MAGGLADLILYNAGVITLDQKQPVAELVAVKGNKILGVGGKDSLELFKGAETRLVDCEGGTVVPGFNDAHCHPLSYAATLLHVDCSPAAVKNIAGIQAGIRRRAERAPAGRWVRAAKYDEFHLAGKRHPNRWELDEAAPRNPVILVHCSGSICVLNSPALSLLGINRETPDPPGGRIGRDPETGEPDGLIIGRNELVEKGVPSLDEEELAEGVRLAALEYLSKGITSLQDTGWSNDLNHWRTFQSLKEQGILPLRVVMLAGSDNLAEFKNNGLSTGSGDEQLRVGGVKIALDESTGCSHPPREDLNDHALRAHKAGFQLALHVNDLYTLEAALAALDFILQEVPRPDHRHRLEHCAVCPPGLLRRLGASGAMIVTQPPFLYHMGDRYLEGISSAQLGWVYPTGSFLKRGLKVAASSDSPVAPCNPLVGIYAAVARKTETGRTLSPWERVSPLEALKMYSLWGAYASFEDGIKGSITPGKLADMAVLNGDPTRTTPEEIKEIKVMLTVIDGRVLWER